VVRFAVRRRLRSVRPDYWDMATLLELAVLAGQPAEAERCLSNALAAIREPWEPITTANNLKMIREARADRQVDVDWLTNLINELELTHQATIA
jgi:hypothetical protein